jgi:DNA-binding HxlR family transcriptional regulator
MRMAENAAPTDPADPLRSPCPLAAALDLVGDRWTLLVIRDMSAGKRRYGQFLASPERITTNILADRLRRLERAGLARTVNYHDRPPRREYLLTDAGRALLPAIRALARWGADNIVGTTDPAIAFAALAADSHR